MSKYLEPLAEAQTRLEAAQTNITILAIQARNDGASWIQIGKALGTTKQAAQRRFSRYVMPRSVSPGHGE